MDKIDIGIKIIANIYLKVIGVGFNGADVPDVPFDVSKIKRLIEADNGTIVWYAETSGKFETFVDIHEYTVEEKKEDIEKAIEEATKYRTAALEKINSLLKEE